MSNNVRTRMAPSPTGSLHIGTLRTALFSYALARHYRGDFILRIEDTDKKREVEGSREEIEKHFKNFGLLWDEYYVQSERKKSGIYEKAAKELLKKGFAFYCQCKPRNAKKEGYSKELRDPCRDKNLSKGAIKLKVPENEIVSYTDYVLRKKISWNTSDVADTALLKTDGFPTYHLAVVVDDTDMKITHALRGYDWLPSTPIHLLVYKYLNYKMPNLGHLTDILDPGGGKLSKRKGSVSVNELLAEGYLPGALLNFVMLLGWAPKDNREIFSLKEFVEVFDQKGLQKSNPVFNRDKLLWMNGEYIRQLSVDEFNDKLQMTNYKWKNKDVSLLKKIIPLVQTRISKLSEFESLAGFFFKTPKVDEKLFGKKYKKHLKTALDAILTIKQFNNEAIGKVFLATVKDNGFKTGDFFMDLRIAICGSKITPPINESIEILGKEETLKRLRNVVKKD